MAHAQTAATVGWGGVGDDAVLAEHSIALVQIQPAAIIGAVGDDGIAHQRGVAALQTHPSTISEAEFGRPSSVVEHLAAADDGPGFVDIYPTADI